MAPAPGGHKVYLCTSDRLAETGGERPHKMKSPQTPFRTTLIGEGLGTLEMADLPLLESIGVLPSLTSASQQS